MTPRCDETDALLAAYALDALEARDRLDLLEHLAECRAHDFELAGYRWVASRLPVALEAVAPPPTLRGGLMRAFDAAKAGVAVPTEAPQSKLLRFLRPPSFAYGLTAVLLALAIGLGAWNLSLRDDNGVAPVIARSAGQGGMSMRVIYISREQLAVLSVDLPPLGPDRTYQAWQITKSGPVSLGTLHHRGAVAFPVDLSGASAIAISVEPAGGSLAPTTTPVLVAGF